MVAGVDGAGIAGGTGVAVWMVGAGSCSTGDVAVTFDVVVAGAIDPVVVGAINPVVAGAIGAEVAGGLDTVVAVMIDE